MSRFFLLTLRRAEQELRVSVLHPTTDLRSLIPFDDDRAKGRSYWASREDEKKGVGNYQSCSWRPNHPQALPKRHVRHPLPLAILRQFPPSGR